jgi:hypothetical protein
VALVDPGEVVETLVRVRVGVRVRFWVGQSK